MGDFPIPPAIRFWAMVDSSAGEDGCWPWLGQTLPNGYGRFRETTNADDPHTYVHRFSYEQAKGPIPDGCDIDHLCRRRNCVNPKHLEAVSRQTNLLRGETIPAANAAKTHCSKGHPYDETNTYWHKKKRQCRTCRSEQDKKRQPRTKRKES